MASAGATLQDVANRAGVSVSTASKAFNNKDEVAAQTRLRVLEAAATLHFTPNALIRSLQRGRTNTIGLCAWPVKSNSGRDITTLLLAGVGGGVADGGLDLLLYSLNPAALRSFTVSSFLDGRVDGLLLGPTVLPLEDLAALTAARLPTVVLYRSDVPDGLGSITIDNTGGVENAVDYLVALGHRRVAFLAPLTTPDYQQRHDGYHSALARHGLDAPSNLCLAHHDWDYDFVAALRVLFTSPSYPTALIAGDDALAFECIETLAALGLRVPGDVSVIGFDDCPAAGVWPGLTTVRQPAAEVGRQAGLFISRLIGGADASECRTRLPVELVVRDTTAACRRGFE